MAQVMDGLVTVLVQKLCTGWVKRSELEDYVPKERLKGLDEKTQPEVESIFNEAMAVKSRQEAKLVYDYLVALEHEGKIRSLQQFGDAAADVDRHLDVASRDRDWKSATAIYNAFASGLQQGPTLAVKAHVVAFSAHSKDMAAGSCNEVHIRKAQELIREVAITIVREVVHARNAAPGRGPDAWHPDVLEAAEKRLAEGDA
jgi:hypothetical protein